MITLFYVQFKSSDKYIDKSLHFSLDCFILKKRGPLLIQEHDFNMKYVLRN